MFEERDIPMEMTAPISEAAELGLIPGVPCQSPYAVQWDKRDEYEDLDFGWIGEDVNGVWCCVHPYKAILEHPKLWSIVDEFRNGNMEIQPGEYETRSGFEFSARLTMAGASARRHERAMKVDHG